MKVKASTLLLSAGLVAATGLAVRNRLPALATVEAAVVMNTVSLALFVMFCEECPEYQGEKATEPHPILKPLTNKQVGALVLGLLLLNYIYSNWQLVRDARGELHVAASVLPPALTSLP